VLVIFQVNSLARGRPCSILAFGYAFKRGHVLISSPTIKVRSEKHNMDWGQRIAWFAAYSKTTQVPQLHARGLMPPLPLY
jgi:hypothetical protein